MTAWLKRIMAELEEITLVDIDDYLLDLQRHEQCVAIVPPDIQKLFVLMARYAKESEALAHSLLPLVRKPPTPDAIEKSDKMFALHRQREVLEAMAWLSCHEIFPELKGKENIVIRKGWRIAYSNNPPQSGVTVFVSSNAMLPFADLLKGALGDLETDIPPESPKRH